MLCFVMLYFTLYEFSTFRVHSLKITNLRVPSKAYHDALLDCRYDLEGATLYDVKWYKDNEQFFRCIPGQSNEYPQDGVKIYYDRYPSIGSCSLRLIALNSKSEGEYKCEVSGEGPFFTTAVESARLRVVPIAFDGDGSKSEDGYPLVITRRSSTQAQELNTTWNAYASKGTPTNTWKYQKCRETWALSILFWYMYRIII